jgi:hypothetical protein
MKYLLAILLLLVSSPAHCGSIRYELPSLLGQHTYEPLTILNAAAQVETPFGFYAVEEATLVVEGIVSQGIAHGDGVIRENTSFALIPRITVLPNFDNSIEFDTEPTPSAFRFEKAYSYPFVPETIPLPNPDGYPPVSFVIYLWVGTSLATQFPPLLGSPDDILSPGIVVDEPIVAHIESAYIVLSGSSIVPEPSSILLVCGLDVLFTNCRTLRMHSQLGVAVE